MKITNTIKEMDTKPIVGITHNAAGEVLICPMGMFSLAEKAWYVPQNAEAKTFDQLDGTEEDSEPIITLMSVEEIVRTVESLDIRSIDQVTESTPEGLYACSVYPYA